MPDSTLTPLTPSSSDWPPMCLHQFVVVQASATCQTCGFTCPVKAEHLTEGGLQPCQTPGQSTNS